MKIIKPLVAAIVVFLLALCASGIANCKAPLLVGQLTMTSVTAVASTTATASVETEIQYQPVGDPLNGGYYKAVLPGQTTPMTLMASAGVEPVPDEWVTGAMEWVAGMYGIRPEALNRDIPAGTVYLGSEGALMNAATGIPQTTAEGFATVLATRWTGVGYSSNLAFAAGYGNNILKPGTLEGSISTIVILVFDVSSQKVVPYYFWVNTLTQKPVYEPFPCFVA
ncbi:MAG: hypothetical protein WA103_04565 [Minisyncoccales bacterium]